MLLGPFTKAGILELLLMSLLLSQGSMKFHKKIGEICHTHLECSNECCITNGKNQKFCTKKTFFMECNPWRKAIGQTCNHHNECLSNCCVPTDFTLTPSCAPRTFFLQCIPWRKMEGEVCSSHKECKSQCCLSRGEDVYRCIPKTGVLTKCLYLSEEKLEADDEIMPRNIQGKWRSRMKAPPKEQPTTVSTRQRG
ncbi:leucine-rich colipase-like protein 1 isoform X2 [Notamacropus eugenii]